MLVLVLVALFSFAKCDLTPLNDGSSKRIVSLPYTNSWAIEIHGGVDAANEIAARHGMTNLGQIASLENIYHFLYDVNNDHKIKGMYGKEQHTRTKALESEPMVKYVKQQTLHFWDKKYLQPTSATDPLWGSQWTVNNTGQTGEPNLFLDLNAEPAWIQGYTGRGIIVSVVDDGLQHYHNDIEDNYNTDHSYDFNSFDTDPSPSSGDSHGTACAGEIAMTRTNDVCGVGVAYDAKVAGIRLLGGATTDATDASAVTYHSNEVDIFSNSWGPPDHGFVVAGPQRLTLMAIRQGAMTGRGGRGNIYTWAAGNGGGSLSYDSCAADGYSQSIYSISVGAYAQNGAPADYDEKCSAKLTVAYVSNTRSSTLDVVTLDLSDRCTQTFSGTSSSTPYVSAVVALALDANPNLTWRDVQYLIVYTSHTESLLSRTDDEFINGAGLTVSHHFGFGAIDAEAMVTRAQHWTNVPSQITANIIPSATTGTARFSSPLSVTFTYSGTMTYLEHIVVTISLRPTGFTRSIDSSEAASIIEEDYNNNVLFYGRYVNFPKRGDIYATLTSPMGSTSTLLFTRPYDLITDGYINWPLLSVLHWGENPNGQWTVSVQWNNTNGGSARLTNVSVDLYGVSSTPSSVSSIPSVCHPSCARRNGGCAAAGAQFCDACNSTLLRNATTRECIQPNECVAPGAQVASGYCYVPSAGWSVIANYFVLIFVLVIAINLF